MSNIARLTWTAVAVENPAGTAAAAPTLWIPCTTVMQNKTKYVYSSEERGTRDGNNRRKGTVRMASGSMKGDIYVDTFPYFLSAFMGRPTSTQPDSANAPTAYQHAYALKDTPDSLTVFKGYDHDGFYWAYTTVNKLKIAFDADAKLLTYEASVEGQYKTAINGAAFTAMTPVYHDVNAFAGYEPAITLGGSASTDIAKFDIELDQKITLYYSARGNRGFLKADYGERTAKMSLSGRFDDTTWTDKETNETIEECIITFNGKSLGGSINEQFKLDFPLIAYDEVDVKTDKEAILVDVKATAMPGLTKNSLFTANVINEITSYAS